MKSGIFDRNGKEVSVGDTILFPYVDPRGRVYEENDNFRAKVIFKHGCFGYESVGGFLTLMSWSETKQGEYVCNVGNRLIILDDYPFAIQE